MAVSYARPWQDGLSASLHQAQNLRPTEQVTADRERDLILEGMTLLEISGGDLRQQEKRPGSNASVPFIKVTNEEDLLELLFGSRRQGPIPMPKVLTTIAETNPRGDADDVFWNIDSNAHLSITVSS